MLHADFLRQVPDLAPPSMINTDLINIHLLEKI